MEPKRTAHTCHTKNFTTTNHKTTSCKQWWRESGYCKYSPDQARDERGRWTSEGAAPSGDTVETFQSSPDADVQLALKYGLEGMHDEAYAFAKESVQSKVEKAFLMDRRAQIYTVGGFEVGKVSMTADVLQETEYSVHTHPSGTPFSDNDIAIFVKYRDMKRTDVVTPDGTVYTLTKGKSWEGRTWSECEKKAVAIKKYWKEEMDKVLPYYHDMHKKGVASAAGLTRLMVNGLVEGIASKWDLVYKTGKVAGTGKKSHVLQHKGVKGTIAFDDTELLQLPSIIAGKGELAT